MIGVDWTEQERITERMSIKSNYINKGFTATLQSFRCSSRKLSFQTVPDRYGRRSLSFLHASFLMLCFCSLELLYMAFRRLISAPQGARVTVRTISLLIQRCCLEQWMCLSFPFTLESQRSNLLPYRSLYICSRRVF